MKKTSSSIGAYPMSLSPPDIDTDQLHDANCRDDFDHVPCMQLPYCIFLTVGVVSCRLVKEINLKIFNGSFWQSYQVSFGDSEIGILNGMDEIMATTISNDVDETGL